MKLLLACFLCAAGIQASASAHVLDEYVQAAQITLTHRSVKVELRLTPGVRVAQRIFTSIDSNGDGQISSTEEQGYAQQVMQDVALELDGRRTPLSLSSIQVPTLNEMNGGASAIRLDLTAETALDKNGEHQLSFTNEHLPKLSVYLVNVLVPSVDAIKVTGQQRDELQRRLQVSFLVNAEAQSVVSSDAPIVVDARTHTLPRWVGVLLAGLCVVLLIRRWIGSSPAKQA
jgi:hypothetical protein